MWAKLKRLAVPTYFSGDGSLIPGAVLQSVMVLLAVLMLVSAPLVLIFFPSLPGLLTFAVAFALFVILFLMLRRGHIQTTAGVLLVVLAALATVANVQWGGLFSPGMSAYILIVMVGGLVLEVRGAVIAALLCVVGMAVMWVLYATGQMPPALVEASELTQFLLTVVHILLGTVLLLFTTQLLRRSVHRLTDSQSTLSSTLATLQEQTISREYFNRIIRSMSNLLVVLDRAGNITVINPQTLMLLGYSEAELIGAPFSKICMTSDRGTISEEHLAEDTTQNHEYVMITRTERHIPISLSMSVMRDEKTNAVRGVVCVAQDISHIKAAESERLRQAMRFRALFEQANDAIFITDIDGHHIAVNKRASEMYGYPNDVLSRMRYEDTISTRELPESKAKFQSLLAGERVPPFERTFVRQDGTEFVGEVSVELVYDSDGKPLHIQSVIRDITERKLAQERIAYQAHLMETVSDAVISTSMDNVIQTWNKAAEKVYGWKADEVIGKKLTDVIPTTVVDAADDPGSFVKQQYIMRGHWQNELEQYSRDGRKLHILSSVSLIRSGSGVHGMVTVNHDITARKYVEAQLEDKVFKIAALRQIDNDLSSTLEVERVAEITLKSAYVLSSADAGFLLLYDAGEMRVMGRIGSYEHLPDASSLSQGIIERVMRTQQGEFITSFGPDTAYPPSNPDTRAQIILPMVSQDRLIGVLNLETVDDTKFTEEIYEYLNLLTSRAAIALDNARLYQLAQQQVAELQNLFQRISEIEQLKTDMIRLARHDIGNQVYIIQGYLTLSDEDIIPHVPEDTRVYFEGMWGAVTRMNEITSEILSLERIDRIANEDMREEVDLRQMLRRVMFENERNAKQKALYMQSDIPAENVVIKADRAQLHEAMFNLVENAIKYTPDNGSVSVKLHATPEEITFTVTDTGIGIPEDQQASIFQPGFRASSPEMESIKGTGWGLYLVKGIVERHNGDMIFESTYGEGSTFGFRLPLVPRPPKAREKKAPTLL